MDLETSHKNTPAVINLTPYEVENLKITQVNIAIIRQLIDFQSLWQDDVYGKLVCTDEIFG